MIQGRRHDDAPGYWLDPEEHAKRRAPHRHATINRAESGFAYDECATECATAAKAPTPPAQWTPPVLLLDFGRTARVVTQADVDRWVRIEHLYWDTRRDLEGVMQRVGLGLDD